MDNIPDNHLMQMTSLSISQAKLFSSLINLLINCLALNRPDAKDTDIESIRDTLVDSLFSFLVTLGRILVHLFCTT